jgi:hypothetical protein
MNSMQLKEEIRKDVLTVTASLQVKMFVHNDPREAEKAISLWLRQNDVKVSHIAQSQSEKNGSFVFVVSVFYSEAD